MVKKKTTLYLTEEYVSALKNHDVNLSAFIDNCMEVYIEILSSTRTELMQRQKLTQRDIEDKKFELKLILEGLLSEYDFKMDDEFFFLVDFQIVLACAYCPAYTIWIIDKSVISSVH